MNKLITIAGVLLVVIGGIGLYVDKQLGRDDEIVIAATSLTVGTVLLAVAFATLLSGRR